MFQRVQYCFRALQGYFQHFEKKLDHLTESRALIFLCPLGKNPVILRNSTKHAKPLLFIAFSENCGNTVSLF